MKIKSNVNTTINKIPIKVGTFNYREIDHKDPTTAEQLKILKSMRLIDFNEKLETLKVVEPIGCNLTTIEDNEEPTEGTTEPSDSDLWCGPVSNEVQDEGSRCGDLAEQWDQTRNETSDNPGKIRRKSRKKKQSVD